MKSVFTMLLVVFVLSACSSLAPTPTLTPIPTSTPVPSPTATLTATLVPSPTPEPPGTIAGVDTTAIGFDVGELVQKGNEIVYAETGEVAAIEVDGVMRFVWGPELIKHLHKVAKLGEMRNGDPYIDQATWDHMLEVTKRMRVPTLHYDHLILRKANRYIDSYSLAWTVSDNDESLMNNEPHDVTIWIEPATHEGSSLEGLIKIRVTQWVSDTHY